MQFVQNIQTTLVQNDLVNSQKKLIGSPVPVDSPCLERICRLCTRTAKAKGVHLFRENQGVVYAQLILDTLNVEVIFSPFYYYNIDYQAAFN